jgi:chromosome partitioning protein
MQTIAIANPKAGCGKTVTAINLGAALASQARRVLLIDLDPQAVATRGLGCDPAKLAASTADIFTNFRISFSEIITKTNIELLHLAPGNILLAGAELSLAATPGKEFILAEQLKSVAPQYDVCVIDCPPSLGLLTVNALVAGTDVIVPINVRDYAERNVRQLMQAVDTVTQRFQPCSVKVAGLLLGFVERKGTSSAQVQQRIREAFGDLVLETVIHRNLNLPKALKAGEPILTWAPNSKSAAEYNALAEQIIKAE